MDCVELRAERTFLREQQLAFHRADFNRKCAKKAAGFRERKTIPKTHANAKPHRVARVARRTGIAHNLLQHAADCPAVLPGRVGLQKPTTSRFLRGSWLDLECSEQEEEASIRAAEAFDECFSPSYEEGFSQVSGLEILACLVPDRKKVSFAESDSTAASELESDLPSSEASEGCGNCEVVSTPANLNVREELEPARNKERVLQGLVRGLQQQRDSTAQENASLRVALERASVSAAKPASEASAKVASAASAKAPAISLREAKRLACERARKLSREASQQKRRQQELESELESKREEAERQAARITSEALLQADALRTRAREVVAMEKLAASADLHHELESTREEAQREAARITSEALLEADTLRSKAHAVVVMETLAASVEIARHDELQSEICSKEEKLQAVTQELSDTLASLESAKQQHLSAVKMAAEISSSPAAQQTVSKSAPITLKKAKDMERQRAQKEQKKAASVRALHKQKEAVRNQMLEEVEQEREKLLAEARQQVLSMTAKAKSQNKALRQKARRNERRLSADSPALKLEEAAAVEDTPQEEAENSELAASPAEVSKPCIVAGQTSTDGEAGQTSTDGEVTEALCGNSVASEVVSEEVSEAPDAQNDAVRDLDWEMLSNMSDEEAAWDLVG